MSKVVRITSKTPCIYTLKIELAPKFLKPTIWRLIEVDGRASLAKLHHFIQAAFGWSDAHLHEYKIHRARYGVPDPEFHDDDYEDDRKFTLNQLLSKGDKFTYLYDFGDHWDHLITVKDVAVGPDFDMGGGAYVLDGERACPPEDVGGVGGYEEMLQLMENEPDSPEALDLYNWLGGLFDPESFDIRMANAAISRMMYNKWGGK